MLKNLYFANCIQEIQKFEMQFGSGITYNSIAENELQESYQKAKTWFEVLKLNSKF